MSVDLQESLQDIFEQYYEAATDAIWSRWKTWSTGLANQQVEEVIIGLLTRQASIATEFLLNPNSWTSTLGTSIVRVMIEVHMTLAWIFLDPAKHALLFRDYGIGQRKLLLEKYKAVLEGDGIDPETDKAYRSQKARLDWELGTELTIVDVGSWSGISFREMAKQTGLPNMHDLSYGRYSAAVHSTWQFVVDNNLRICDNPLHRYHFVPDTRLAVADVKLMQSAARYFEKSLRLFDEKTGIKVESRSPFEVLEDALERLAATMQSDSVEEESRNERQGE